MAMARYANMDVEIIVSVYLTLSVLRGKKLELWNVCAPLLVSGSGS